MDLHLLALILIFILLCAGIIFRKGWKAGAIILGYIIGCIAIYTIVLKIWGQDGKNYLAIGSIIIVLIVIFIRKKKGL